MYRIVKNIGGSAVVDINNDHINCNSDTFLEVYP